MRVPAQPAENAKPRMPAAKATMWFVVASSLQPSIRMPRAKRKAPKDTATLKARNACVRAPTYFESEVDNTANPKKKRANVISAKSAVIIFLPNVTDELRRRLARAL